MYINTNYQVGQKSKKADKFLEKSRKNRDKSIDTARP